MGVKRKDTLIDERGRSEGGTKDRADLIGVYALEKSKNRTQKGARLKERFKG